jgi:3-phosphoshikimate 1-carboxyvinyltransferase
MIDEFPAFAAAAVTASGETLVCDAVELRQKESDRITALCNELRRLGCDAEERPDGFVIRGGKPAGGVAHSHNDHRLAMALSLVGLASSQPVVVQGAEIIAESYPDFYRTLAGFGARIDEA